jgi:DNA-binding NarL/FixJ family response regulator
MLRETARRTEGRLRIFVADDHKTVRKGVCTLLSSRSDLEVCGEAQDGKEAIEKTRELKPDLIILDITMPVLDGFAAVRKLESLCQMFPSSYSPCTEANGLYRRLGYWARRGS